MHISLPRTRRADPPGPPVDAFVLSGGGALGAAQVGALKALTEAGIRPDFVVGCSVGALNAAFFACNPTAERARELEQLWLTLHTTDVFGRGRAVVGHLVRRHTHIYDPHALHALIRRGMTVDDLEHTAVPVHVVTTDLHTGRPRWWSSGPALDLLSASACLPGIFPPVELDESLHVDGGVTCPVPVQRALDLGADRVWVIDVRGGTVGRRDSRMTALDVLLLSFSITRDALSHGLPVDARARWLPRIDTGPVDLRDFSRTKELIDESYRVTAEFLATQGPVPVSLVHASAGSV